MDIHAAEYRPGRSAPNRDQGVCEPTDQHGDDENEQRPAQRRAVVVERTPAVHAQNDACRPWRSSSFLSDLCDPTGVPSQFSGGCQERRMIVSVGLLRLHLKSYGAKPPQYQAPSLQLFASCDAGMCGMFFGTYRTMTLHANCRSGRNETCAAWRPFGGLGALEIPGRHCCGRSRMSAHWSRKRTCRVHPLV